MAIPLLGLIPSVISGVVGLFNKKEETKANKQSAEAKLRMKKLDSSLKMELTDAEWEAISAKGLDNSWKDEYVTIIVTAPIVGYLVGSVWWAFTGDESLLIGVSRGVKELKDLGLDWATLTTGVVFAAIGLKLWRAK